VAAPMVNTRKILIPSSSTAPAPKSLASGNLAENVPDSNSDQHCGHRVIADERLYLIMGLARLIDLPLARLASVGNGSLWSVTHIPAFSLPDRISSNARRRLEILIASLSI
jgi:hypothetical protein